MNKFTNDLYNELLKNNLSPSSIKLYLRNLEKLNNNKPLQNFKFLEKIEDVKKYISTYKPNTQRSFYISIVSIIKLYKDVNKKMTLLYTTYYNLMMNINKEIKSNDTEIKTETQQKNWLEWDEILKKKNDLYDIIKNYNDKLTNEEYNNVLNFLIISLYTLQPPRRNLDYMKMLIIKKYNDNYDKSFNYIDNDKFYFNFYKTSKKEGGVILPINEELKKVINFYYKYHPLYKKLTNKTNIYFLVDFNGNPLLKINDITKRINKIMNKKIGSSMLRHIYLSYKYKNVKSEQDADSIAMSHSLQTQKDYIKTGGNCGLVSFN